MGMPNFIIIGAAKSGTTALYETLRQHPQIYMSAVKEPNFFALENINLDAFRGKITPGYLNNCITDLQSYQRQFDYRNGETIAGEASPIYLYHPDAAKKIKLYVPNVKLIVILRNPVERAFSNYLHHIRDGLETSPSFQQALDLEDLRIRENWWWGFFYKQAGLYHSQIERYLDFFPKERLKIIFYEDFQKNPLRTIQEIFEYLNVDAFFYPDISGQYNATGIPVNKFAWNFISKSHPVKEPLKKLIPYYMRQNFSIYIQKKALKKPSMSPEVRNKLVDIFKSEVLQLQDLVQRDLSDWNKVE